MAGPMQCRFQYANKNYKRILSARNWLRPSLQFVGAIANVLHAGKAATKRMKQCEGQSL